MKHKSKATVLLVILLPVIFNNCTILGVAGGTAIDKKQNRERPVMVLNNSSEIEFEKNQWLEVIKKNGEKVEGKYLEANYLASPSHDSSMSLMPQSIKINIMGQKEHEDIMLNDIDHVVVGFKHEEHAFIGALLGAAVDITVLAIYLLSTIGF